MLLFFVIVAVVVFLLAIGGVVVCPFDGKPTVPQEQNNKTFPSTANL
jgi:hypothetical protein